MKYSIIIPTYNHCDDLLKPCLQSIIDYTDLTEVEVIVIANGCVDNTREYVNSLGHPFKLIWITEPAGFVRATNKGIQESSGEYVVLLNNDTELSPQPMSEWLKKLEEPFSEKYTGITGPSKHFNHKISSTAITFYCAMIKREVIDKVGILDEEYSPGGIDDFDYCERVLRAGYSLKEVRVNVEHKENQTFGSNSYQYGLTVTRNEQYFKKKFGDVDKYLNERNIGADYIKYSIIIPTSDACDDFLKACVDSIFKYSNMGDKELIISAHGCTDNTREYLLYLQHMFTQFGFTKHIKIIWSDSYRSYAEACNAAITASRSSRLIFLNPDAVLIRQHKDSWINMLESALELDDTCGISCVVTHNYKNIEYPNMFCTMILKDVFSKTDNFSTDYGQSRVEIIDFGAAVKAHEYTITTVGGNFPVYYTIVMDKEHQYRHEPWDDLVNYNLSKLDKKYNLK